MGLRPLYFAAPPARGLRDKYAPVTHNGRDTRRDAQRDAPAARSSPSPAASPARTRALTPAERQSVRGDPLRARTRASTTPDFIGRGKLDGDLLRALRRQHRARRARAPVHPAGRCAVTYRARSASAAHGVGKHGTWCGTGSKGRTIMLMLMPGALLMPLYLLAAGFWAFGPAWSWAPFNLLFWTAMILTIAAGPRRVAATTPMSAHSMSRTSAVPTLSASGAITI
jgi:hypothetical protein